jgi:hypothetical protein
MPNCPECNRFYLILNFDLCPDCCYQRERRDERLGERDPSLTLAAIASWAMTDTPPHRYAKAWECW